MDAELAAAAIVMVFLVVVLGGLAIFGFIGSIWLMWEEDRAGRKLR